MNDTTPYPRWLADDAVWASQDPWTGRLLTSPRAAGIVVAAAALGDLTHARALQPSAGHITVTRRAPARFGNVATTPQPPVDALGTRILHQIRHEPDLSTHEVIDGLAVDIRRRVTARMIRAGTARPRRRRLLWARQITAIAADPDRTITIAPVAALYSGRPPEARDRFLLHLINASSLGTIALGHLRQTTITRAIGPAAGVGPAYQPLLEAATDLLHDLALAR
ncbi:GPP34 family phosphoprotein [Actinoplanes sp. Pm04-4]|uniref:GPP34 family phosphoprotein n=1 Tax=Paractinoplanes pyxinae TaxID=2997416 RepID=A0ABT4BC03_9ACTN|nr:GPP34 family phosphoprotein [Actinoplanes pyxinae]MCY1144054.1 GPP34 family phosphoprotein [Actinoplanes pyxinae]